MDAETKAKELFTDIHYQICNDCGLWESDSTITAAKNTALIAIKEILNSLIYKDVGMNAEEKITYWQSVKDHIQKL